MCSPEADALLASIRTEIRTYGQSVISCDKLLLLIAPNDPIGTQYGHIFLTAQTERWSFQFRNDGTVRFADVDRESFQDEVEKENRLPQASSL
jgi:hypothetical protein